MRYFEDHDGNYITTFGKASHGGETITEERYNALVEAVQNAPEETETIGYRLKTDLTWESYEKEPDPEPEPTAEEILDILLGGDSE